MDGLFGSFVRQQTLPKSVEMKSFANVSTDDKENLPSLNLGIDKLYDQPNSDYMQRELGNIYIKIKEQLDYATSKSLWRPTMVQVLCLFNNQWQTLTLQELNGTVEISLKAQPGRSVVLKNVKSIANLHEALKQNLPQ